MATETLTFTATVFSANNAHCTLTWTGSASGSMRAETSALRSGQDVGFTDGLVYAAYKLVQFTCRNMTGAQAKTAAIAGIVVTVTA